MLPSPRLNLCELTHRQREPIDHASAVRQHADYCTLLQRCGAEVRVLTVNRDFPDSVFIEDTAVVLDEVAVLASMGAESRRGEPAGIEPELRRHREIVRLEFPATLEGGDVLRVRNKLLVGISSRTNQAGRAALAEVGARFGYQVLPVPVHGCLHLKSAVTALPDGTLLLNAALAGHQSLDRFSVVAGSRNRAFSHQRLAGRWAGLPAQRVSPNSRSAAPAWTHRRNRGRL